MKNKICNLLLLLCFISSGAVNASVILTAKKMKINVQDNAIELSNIQLYLFIKCSYGGGGYWGRSTECGAREYTLSPSKNSSFDLPQLETFEGWFNVGDLDNYYIEISVYEKNSSRSFGRIQLFGKKDIEEFAKNVGNITIASSKGFSVKVIANNEDFFSSDLSKNQTATLTLGIRALKLNSFEYFWYRSNISPSGKPPLKNEVEISIPPVRYFSFGNNFNTLGTIVYSYRQPPCFSMTCENTDLNNRYFKFANLDSINESYVVYLNH